MLAQGNAAPVTILAAGYFDVTDLQQQQAVLHRHCRSLQSHSAVFAAPHPKCFLGPLPHPAP